MPEYPQTPEDIDLSLLWARELALDETAPAQARTDARRYIMLDVIANMTAIIEGTA